MDLILGDLERNLIMYNEMIVEMSEQREKLMKRMAEIDVNTARYEKYVREIEQTIQLIKDR